jgi:hypothetical protein
MYRECEWLRMRSLAKHGLMSKSTVRELEIDWRTVEKLFYMPVVIVRNETIEYHLRWQSMGFIR